MRASLMLASLCLVAAAIAAVVVCNPRADYPVDVKIAGMETNPEPLAKTLTVQFQRLNPTQFVRFEYLRLQTRITGRWQEPFKVALEHRLLAGTNFQQIGLFVPAQTEACRFLIGYRVGPRPYCKVYFFFGRHGLWKRFPKTCQFAIKFVPKEARLREVEVELVIPEQMQVTG